VVPAAPHIGQEERTSGYTISLERSVNRLTSDSRSDRLGRKRVLVAGFLLFDRRCRAGCRARVGVGAASRGHQPMRASGKPAGRVDVAGHRPRRAVLLWRGDGAGGNAPAAPNLSDLRPARDLRPVLYTEVVNPISRRALLRAPALLPSAALLSRTAAASDERPAAGKIKIAIFSKHLHFLKGDDLARATSEMGFDGIDLTVRKGGHIEPARVAQDLPPLVKTIRAHSLEVPMITTDIVDTETPFVEDILKTMAALGIRYYRWGGLKFTPNETYPAQLERMKPRIARLAALNARYHACAMYHTHSGISLVGTSIWDLYILLKDFDPQSVGVNYDVGHATVEGGFGGWINSFRITGPHLRGIAVKDFLWGKDARGNWRPEWKPIGEGMVRFPEFFRMVAAAGFDGPLQLHFEYPLGGANDGKTALTMPREQIFAAMRRDLAKLRRYMAV
jgi:sugar phosphate isomerase/epimerase